MSGPMYPGFFHWWQQQQQKHHGGCEARASCGPRHGHHHHHHHGRHDDDMMLSGEDGSAFGVRRPLRFMAHRLELRPEQIAELAGILDSLKTERAQAAVDDRRSVGAFADAIAAEAFDASAAMAEAQIRVKSAERLRDAVVKALERTHKMLDADQRKQLAYLLRSGQLTI